MLANSNRLDELIPILLPHYSLENGELTFMGFRKKKVDVHVKLMLGAVNGRDSLLTLIKKHPDFSADRFLDLERLGFLVLCEPMQPRCHSRPSILILSPHADDAIFSLSGLMLKYRQYFEFHIVNIFGRQDFTLYQQFGATKIGRDFVHKEEKIAWRLLNIASGRFLSFEDAAMRKPHRTSRLIDADRESQAIVSEEAGLFENIAREIDRLVRTMAPRYLFCPLGIGKHVDHILVREAVVQNPSLCDALYLYDELPYALTFDRKKEVTEIERRFGNRLEPRRIEISGFIQGKRRLLGLYASQLKRFQMTAMLSHATRSNGRSYEDYWRLTPDCNRV